MKSASAQREIPIGRLDLALSFLLACFWLSAANAAAPQALSLGTPFPAQVAADQAPAFTLELVSGSRAILEVHQLELDTVAVVTAPDGSQQSFDEGGKGEVETLQLDANAAGSYRIALTPFEPALHGRAEIVLKRIMRPAEVVQFVAAEALDRSRFVDWVRSHALRLRTPMARSGLDDLQGLRGIVGDAHLVLMGEPTHGNREVFQLKHRLFEYLVSALGFSGIAFELSMPEARAIDRYVLTGEGTPEQALAGTYFWVYNTEEVLDLVRWMRAYNADPKHGKKLRFYGIDMQFPVLAARDVQQYLKEVGYRAQAGERALLDRLGNALSAYGASTGMSQPDAAAAKPLLASLEAAFTDHAEAWTAISGAERYTEMRQMLRLCAQYLEMTGADKYSDRSEVRDRAMAENLRWVLAQQPAGARFAAWAHNLHVQKAAPAPDGFMPMGGHLAQALGDDLRIIGFRFDRGGFQATDLVPGDTLGRRDFIVAPIAGSFDEAVGAAGLGYALIDLRGIPEDAARWLQTPRKMRDIGSGTADIYADFSIATLPLTQFDALAFIETTTPARPLPMSAAAPQRLTSDLVDGDFELPTTDLSASPWMFDPSSVAYGYVATIAGDAPHSGQRYLRLHRDPSTRFGAKPGFVTALIDATALRGKTLRLSLWSRLDAASVDAAGYVALESLSTETSTPETGVEPDHLTPLPGSTHWKRTRISLAVAPDVTHLRLRFLLAGDGQLDIDEVTLKH